MLEIKNKNFNYEFNFEGLKIFESQNTTKLYKNLFYDSEIKIDNKLIKNENIIFINELTKISDLVDLSKKSVLMNMILEHIHENNILNKGNLNNIKDKINEFLEYELLDVKDSDIVKIISLVFELLDDKFLNNEILEIILDKIFTEKKLIIFDNVSWLSIHMLQKFINNHDFIILTNDIRNAIDSYQYLLCYVNEQLNEFLDIEILINYLQQKINNENITHESLINFLNNKDDLVSLKIHNILKKI